MGIGNVWLSYSLSNYVSLHSFWLGLHVGNVKLTDKDNRRMDGVSVLRNSHNAQHEKLSRTEEFSVCLVFLVKSQVVFLHKRRILKGCWPMNKSNYKTLPCTACHSLINKGL